MAASKYASDKEQLKSELQLDAIRAKAGDPDALARVWTNAMPIAQACANRYQKKYDWIDGEELSQNLLTEIPRILARYDPEKNTSTSWGKYIYCSLNFVAKDWLRKEDPCGIKWPQKKQYPSWHRLGDKSLDGFEITDHRDLLAEVDREADQHADESNSENNDIIAFQLSELRSVSKKPVRIRWANKRRKAYSRAKFKFSVRMNRFVGNIARQKAGLKVFNLRKVNQVEVSQSSITSEQASQREPSEQAVEPAEQVVEPISQPEHPEKKPLTDKQREAYASRGRAGAAARAANKKAGSKKRDRSGSSKPASEVDAFRLLSMATEFSAACGGIRRAIELLQQASSLK